MSKSELRIINSLQERADELLPEHRAQGLIIETLCEIARQLAHLGDITADVLVPPTPHPTEPALDAANKVLSRIATVCIAALDPEISREQVIVRVKDIYTQAVSLRADEDEEIYEH